MSLWLDFLGVEVRYVETPTYGRIRIAESGRGKKETIVFQHGINGHLEAYAKNIASLSPHFHVIAFDYVGHGLSSKPEVDYTPMLLADQLRELLDVLGLDRVHLSGESLGGWVSAMFACKYPERVSRLMLNTAGGLPVVSEKGKEDLRNLIALNRRNIDNVPTYESVKARLEWLMHPLNKGLVNDELISLRLRIYLMPETRAIASRVTQIIEKHDDYLIPFEDLRNETLFLWTRDNPIHDLEAARAASARVPGSRIYVMKGDAAHWPQYEVPEEFDSIVLRFFKDGVME